VQLLNTWGAHFEADGLSLKGTDLSHMQRLGGARMMRVPGPEAPFLDRVGAFQRALRRQLEGGETYDLVHATDLWVASEAVQHKEGSGFRLVTEVEELPSEVLADRQRTPAVGDAARQALRRAEVRALEQSDVVLVGTKAAARLVVQAGAHESRVRVVPAGVDDAVFSAPKLSLNLENGDAFDVLYAGETDPLRGLQTFLGALKVVPERVRGILLRYRGKDRDAEAAVATHGLAGRVRWLDVTSPQSLAAAFQEARVVVLLPLAPLESVHGARVPRRLLEAMLCRKPVVVGETRGVKEVVAEKETGLLVPARNTRSLAQALTLLHGDAGLRARLGEAGAHVAAQLVWRERAMAVAKVYDELLGTHLCQKLLPAVEHGGPSLAERLRRARRGASPSVSPGPAASRPAALPGSPGPAGLTPPPSVPVFRVPSGLVDLSASAAVDHREDTGPLSQDNAREPSGTFRSSVPDDRDRTVTDVMVVPDPIPAEEAILELTPLPDEPPPDPPPDPPADPWHGETVAMDEATGPAAEPPLPPVLDPDVTGEFMDDMDDDLPAVGGQLLPAEPALGPAGARSLAILESLADDARHRADRGGGAHEWTEQMDISASMRRELVGSFKQVVEDRDGPAPGASMDPLSVVDSVTQPMPPVPTGGAAPAPVDLPSPGTPAALPPFGAWVPAAPLKPTVK
jgi:glycosyltransferase involved in cell wall biosynthesis